MPPANDVKWTDVVTALFTALAAVGTVTGLVFIAIQAFLLRRQTRDLHTQLETDARQQHKDEERRQQEYRVSLTPVIALEIKPPSDAGADVINDRDLLVHVLGSGTAHNVRVFCNAKTTSSLEKERQKLEKPIWEGPLLMSGREERIPLPKITMNDVAERVRAGARVGYTLEVGYYNMFGEHLMVAYEAQPRPWRMLSGPRYRAPWGWGFGFGTSVRIALGGDVDPPA